MADQWIDAATALDLIKNPLAICERCHAGLIRTRANVLKRDEEELRDVEVPRGFWWAEGHAALEQNWTTGDFSTWIDNHHARAFGISFALDDMLALVPFDQHAATRRRLSVAGNPDWVSAQEARRFAYSEAGISPTLAGKAVIEQCRLGFITARAVEMRFALGADPEKWTVEVREWDVRRAFWEDFAIEKQSSQGWEDSIFSGRSSAGGGRGWMTLNGVYFLRSSLEILLPSPRSDDSVEPPESGKPRLSDAALDRWWEKLGPARDALSQAQLWTLVKADHPESSVARDRIRELTEGRTPGPKPNSATIDR